MWTGFLTFARLTRAFAILVAHFGKPEHHALIAYLQSGRVDPVYPNPSRKDGLFAEEPKGGDRGDRELRFSKRRCEIEPGTRDSDLRRGARRAYGGEGGGRACPCGLSLPERRS